MGVMYGQAASLGRVSGMYGSRNASRINATIDMTNVQQDSLEAYATDFTTGNLNADSVMVSGKISIGEFGDTQVVLPTETQNTSPLLGLFPMVNYAAASGKVFAGAHSRMLFNTAHQTNGVNGFGMESQFRLKNVNLAGEYHGGLWAYAEQSGTTTLSGGGYLTALFAMVESESTLTVGSSENICGIVIDGAINSGVSMGSANYSGIFIESRGLDFTNGIYITGSTTDIKLQNGATIDNVDADTLTFTEANVEIEGAFFVTGTSIESDWAITDEQVPLLDYWAKTQELNRLPAFENKNRKNVMLYVSGLEETSERLLRYIIELEARITELEK